MAPRFHAGLAPRPALDAGHPPTASGPDGGRGPGVTRAPAATPDPSGAALVTDRLASRGSGA